MESCEVDFSSPLKTDQINLNVYNTVTNETKKAAPKINHRQDKPESFQSIREVRMASLDKNPLKNGSPANALPLTINMINVKGSLF